MLMERQQSTRGGRFTGIREVCVVHEV